MNITSSHKNNYLELKLEGRLDAAWAEHFVSTVSAAMREGRHHIRVDALGLSYLSSAGMRSLLRAHRELTSVNGSFAVIRASDFVVNTLSMSGFDTLLALDEAPAEAVADEEATSAKSKSWSVNGVRIESYSQQEDGHMEVHTTGKWTPWQPLREEDCAKIALGRDCIAIGSGAPADEWQNAREQMGDYASAAGCTAWLPGTGADAPDYLVQEGRYVPELLAASGLRAVGSFSQLLRFSPENDGASLELPRLLEAVFSSTGSTKAAFVAIAEAGGLVGVTLSRSPGLISEGEHADEFPGVRDWMSFCGERVHHGRQVLLVGFADASGSGQSQPGLPAIPSRPGWKLHVHAVVFPFRPLPNGEIFMSECVEQLFAAAEPIAMLHLVEDERPTLGLGKSSFIRGACWCAPASFHTENRK